MPCFVAWGRLTQSNPKVCVHVIVIMYIYLYDMCAIPSSRARSAHLQRARRKEKHRAGIPAQTPTLQFPNTGSRTCAKLRTVDRASVSPLTQ